MFKLRIDFSNAEKTLLEYEKSSYRNLDKSLEESGREQLKNAKKSVAKRTRKLERSLKMKFVGPQRVRIATGKHLRYAAPVHYGSDKRGKRKDRFLPKPRFNSKKIAAELIKNIERNINSG